MPCNPHTGTSMDPVDRHEAWFSDFEMAIQSRNAQWLSMSIRSAVCIMNFIKTIDWFTYSRIDRDLPCVTRSIRYIP